MAENNVTRIDRAKEGDHAFLSCPCSPEETTITPVAVLDRQGPIITALVCVECETSIDVVNGVVQERFEGGGH